MKLQMMLSVANFNHSHQDFKNGFAKVTQNALYGSRVGKPCITARKLQADVNVYQRLRIAIKLDMRMEVHVYRKKGTARFC